MTATSVDIGETAPRLSLDIWKLKQLWQARAALSTSTTEERSVAGALTDLCARALYLEECMDRKEAPRPDFLRICLEPVKAGGK